MGSLGERKDGVIVSAMVGGEPVTIHVGELPTQEALRVALGQLEALGSFRIRAISTPSTIYGDLRGERSGVLPETMLLSRIGRAGLSPRG